MANQPHVTRFYRVRDRFGEFSNFAPFSIHLNGREWPTSEHYFQAQKFAGTEHEEAIRRAATPMLAAEMGRERDCPLRADWETVKDDIMRVAVRAKFRQHPTISALLVSTRDAVLIEHTKNDCYWGDGGDGTGKNMLGQILMEVRDEITSRLSGRLLPLRSMGDYMDALANGLIPPRRVDTCPVCGGAMRVSAQQTGNSVGIWMSCDACEDCCHGDRGPMFPGWEALQ